jgi:hypothetical protein
MSREHRASIEWTADLVAAGLPDFLATTDPAWLVEPLPDDHSGWSLRCRFDSSPRDQGNPSIAFVQYLFPEAPYGAWHVGAQLQLFERKTQQRATVTLLD